MIRLSDREAQRLRNRLIDPSALPVAAAAPECPSEALQPAQIDDATTAYVVKMREPFELLRQAVAQVAGLLVLAAASGEAIAGHPMLELATDAVRRVESEVPSVKVPARARHHHWHVVQALSAIGLAFPAARRGLVRRDEAAIDAVLGPLRSAHQHLLWATAALPGFEVVALSQACCARHATVTNPRSQ